MNWRPRSWSALLFPMLLVAAAPGTAALPPPIGDVMAGEFALQEGDLEAAARYYLLAAQVSPDAGLAERATRVAVLADQPAMAERALARWRTLAPESLPMRAAALSLAMRQGEHERAMDEVRELFAAQGDDGFQAMLAVLSQARGDEAVVARGVARSIHQEALLPQTLSAWLQFAGLARRLDDRPLSDQLVEAGLARFPDDPRARLLRASRLRETGDEAAARDALLALGAADDLPEDLRRPTAGELARLGAYREAAALLATAPQDDGSYGQRAAWLVAAEDPAGLLALYREVEALAASPSPSRRLLLGHLAEALERWSDAERWYAGIPRGAGHDLAMLRRARALDQLDRADDALDLLHELQADESADGERQRDSYLFESELLERRQRRDEALTAIDKGLKVFEDDPVMLYARAMLHERGDRVDAALADLRRIIDENPEDAQALNAYGYTLADRTGRFAEALPYIERAYALEPESAPVIDSLGWVNFNLGRTERALELLQRAWARLKDPEIAAHLGEVLWSSGRHEEARTVWLAGAEIDADNPALRRAMEKFKP
jgi:tetratricopeptide (TPR) repeat protein